MSSPYFWYRFLTATALQDRPWPWKKRLDLRAELNKDAGRFSVFFFRRDIPFVLEVGNGFQEEKMSQFVLIISDR